MEEPGGQATEREPEPGLTPWSSVRRTAKRPIAVTIVAVLAAAYGIYSAAAGVLAIRDAGGDDGELANGAFYVAVAAGALIAAFGAWRLQPWGWAVFMTWAVIGLTHQILRVFFFGDPNYGDMAISTIAVLALSPLDVQIAFGLRHTKDVELSRPTRNPVDG